MNGRSLTRILALAVAAAGCGGPAQIRSGVGPGSGFLTTSPPLARAVRPDVRLTPILTVGDTLVSNEPGAPPFVFPVRPKGLGARDRGDGTADLYVAHEDVWLQGFEGGAVTRLTLDLRNAGVLAAEVALRPERGYQGLSHAALVDARVGFLRPAFLINERGHERRFPVVAALDALSGSVQDLPWLGAMRHKSTVALPAAGGRTILMLTGGPSAGSVDQLYLYIANSDADVLVGQGTLHVLRVDPTAVPYSSRSASRLRRGVSVSGTFVPVEGAAARSPAELEAQVQGLGCLNFARLEGIAIDREKPNAFYFIDRLGSGQAGFATTSVAGGGRLYHVTLDPFDPTQVQELTVLLDAGEGDDLFRPSGIDTDEQVVMIQEFPGTRGVHPSRILRYFPRERRLEVVAECAERDSRGRMDPRGVGGEWETSGITNVSDLFGEDSWVFTVQAHNLSVRQDRFREGRGGQLLLLRGPRNPAR